jgi:hypothetical protein
LLHQDRLVAEAKQPVSECRSGDAGPIDDYFHDSLLSNRWQPPHPRLERAQPSSQFLAADLPHSEAAAR